MTDQVWLEVSTVAELAMIGYKRILRAIARDAWRGAKLTTRQVADRAGGADGNTRYQILLTSLPPDLQERWRRQQNPILAEYPAPEPKARAPRGRIAYDAAALWDWYDRKPGAVKARAEQRLALLTDALDLHETGGHTLQTAFQLVAARGGKSARVLERWWHGAPGRPGAKHYERHDWLPALCPGWTGRQAQAGLSPEAWDWFKGQYLSRRQPTLEDTYRRLQAICAKEGWAVPALRTLTRRLNASVPQSQQIYLREGAEALRKRFPAAQIDKRSLYAGEYVVGDGLKFDTLYIEWPDGDICGATTAWFWQCGYSNKILAYRVGKTENTDIFRLATYDLTAITLPRLARLDNTRVAANKAMTGQHPNRHRFKNSDLDPRGILTQLGIALDWTNPDTTVADPGVKGIERSFGIGGIHDMVRTHPQLVGKGYSQSIAIPLPLFLVVLQEEVARFNSQLGRKTPVCQGVKSFDQAFADSFKNAPVRRASDSIRRLLLMLPEVVRAHRDTGELALKAGQGPMGKNRYWDDLLAPYAGQHLVAYYDPAALHAGVQVYTRDERYIGEIPCIAPIGFGDADAVREWGKNKRRWLKAQRDAAKAQTRMDALERAQRYPAPEPDETPRAPVVQGTFKPRRPVAAPTADDRDAAFISAVNRAFAGFEQKLREKV